MWLHPSCLTLFNLHCLRGSHISLWGDSYGTEGMVAWSPGQVKVDSALSSSLYDDMALKTICDMDSMESLVNDKLYQSLVQQYVNLLIKEPWLMENMYRLI